MLRNSRKSITWMTVADVLSLVLHLSRMLSSGLNGLKFNLYLGLITIEAPEARQEALRAGRSLMPCWRALRTGWSPSRTLSRPLSLAVSP